MRRSAEICTVARPCAVFRSVHRRLGVQQASKQKCIHIARVHSSLAGISGEILPITGAVGVWRHPCSASYCSGRHPQSTGIHSTQAGGSTRQCGNRALSFWNANSVVL